MNVLGQNPALHVTPTSGLVHLMRHVIDRWPQSKEFRSQGLEHVKPRVLSGLRGLLYGFYEKPLAEGQTVFDKSRGWLQYIEPLEEILGRRVKLITMVRDVRAIAASFEKLYRSRGIEYRVPRGRAAQQTATTEQRARHLLAPNQVIGRSLWRVRDALQRCPDRLLIIPYRHFTSHPRETLATIEHTFGLPPGDYDPDHVVQVTHEDDNHHGRRLHQIRPQIETPPPQPWQGILPDSLADELAEAYADLNALAAGAIVDDGAPT